MTPLAQEWVEAAANDLAAARLMLAHGGPRAITCFHCQQAAEKLLKAYLQEQGVAPPRTHSLPQLLTECEAREASLKTLRPAVQRLNRYYITTRYPPTLAAPSEEDTREAVTLAAQVETAVLDLLPP
jgi:HEPN domain-containing protein